MAEVAEREWLLKDEALFARIVAEFERRGWRKPVGLMPTEKELIAVSAGASSSDVESATTDFLSGRQPQPTPPATEEPQGGEPEWLGRVREWTNPGTLCAQLLAAYDASRSQVARLEAELREARGELKAIDRALWPNFEFEKESRADCITRLFGALNDARLTALRAHPPAQPAVKDQRPPGYIGAVEVDRATGEITLYGPDDPREPAPAEPGACGDAEWWFVGWLGDVRRRIDAGKGIPHGDAASLLSQYDIALSASSHNGDELVRVARLLREARAEAEWLRGLIVERCVADHDLKAAKLECEQVIDAWGRAITRSRQAVGDMEKVWRATTPPAGVPEPEGAVG
jgi:hypothetical protein